MILRLLGPVIQWISDRLETDYMNSVLEEDL